MPRMYKGGGKGAGAAGAAAAPQQAPPPPVIPVTTGGATGGFSSSNYKLDVGTYDGARDKYRKWRRKVGRAYITA